MNPMADGAELGAVRAELQRRDAATRRTLDAMAHGIELLRAELGGAAGKPAEPTPAHETPPPKQPPPRAPPHPQLRPPGVRRRAFLSYARGAVTTPFSRWLKAEVEASGYDVWMDESGIASGADWMRCITTQFLGAAGSRALRHWPCLPS